MIDQCTNIKKLFENQFRQQLIEVPALKQLLLTIFVYGTAYIVGGYFRDFLEGKKSRDIDIIVDVDNVKLLDIINDSNLNYTENRHGGIKLQLGNIVVDLWSLENNWAFKNKLVKLNQSNKLNSIAKGCFFNYDSLVINLHDFSYNIEYYSKFLRSNTLDILQKLPIYKNMNPTIEANIIRAFFMKQKMNVDFSEELIEYILKKLDVLNDLYSNGVKRIVEIKSKYPKYSGYTDEQLIENILSFIKRNKDTSSFPF